MKKIIFIYFLFLSCLSFAQSPSLLDSNVIWREYIDQGMICGTGHCAQTYWECVDYVDGDTSIAGILYKKIYRTGTSYYKYSVLSTSTITPTFHCREYTAAIRADSSRHLYIVSQAYVTQRLLYDFNLSVGDTLPQTYNCTGNTCSVKSIDSVLINGVFRKRFNIGLLPAGSPVINSIVEGIGANTGLLNYFGYHPLAPTKYSKLRGFYIDSAIVYNPYAIPGTLISCESLTTDIAESKEVSQWQIYPNPSNGIITIETEDHESAQLEIYNSMGKRIISELINNGKTTIDLSTQANGIYFAKIYQQDKTGVIKIIKE